MLEKFKYNKSDIEKLIKFRTQYIHKSQTKAAKLIGTSQANLSRMESGVVPINAEIVNTLIKQFGMSKEWWYNNIGTMRGDDTKIPKTIIDVGLLREEVSSLGMKVKILEANLNQAIKFIESQGKIIEALNKKLDGRK